MDDYGNIDFWWVALIVVGVGVLAARGAVADDHRRRKMRDMADRLGLLPWPEDQLPRDLSMRKTPLESWSGLRNVYEGLLNGHQVAFMDMRRQNGDSSRSRTVIAIRQKENSLARKPFYLETAEAVEWTLFYPASEVLSSSRLMDVGEIEELLRELSR